MSTYLVSFDDTDNLETIGTGHVLAGFLAELPCKTSYITRHQLFVDERVPFTSHNSAMCAQVEGEMELAWLIERAAHFLEASRAEGSDPGLCVAPLDDIAHIAQLVEWGRRAKSEVLFKADAYELAAQCGVHLSEHGGDGQGVVGALAAVGLRLSGNDGRVRGKARIEAGCMTVRELLDRTGFERVCAYGRGVLDDSCVVDTQNGEVKAIYQDFSSTVLTTPAADETYTVLGKRHLKSY